MFTGLIPYVLLGAMVLSAGGIGFGLFERGNLADAKAANATLAATNNELADTHATDLATIERMALTKKIDDQAIAQRDLGAMQISAALAAAQEKVKHATASTNCQSLDARDAAALGGLRDILGTAADHPDQGSPGAPAGKPADLSAGTGDPGKPQ